MPNSAIDAIAPPPSEIPRDNSYLESDAASYISADNFEMQAVEIDVSVQCDGSILNSSELLLPGILEHLLQMVPGDINANMDVHGTEIFLDPGEPTLSSALEHLLTEAAKNVDISILSLGELALSSVLEQSLQTVPEESLQAGAAQ